MYEQIMPIFTRKQIGDLQIPPPLVFSKILRKGGVSIALSPDYQYFPKMKKKNAAFCICFIELAVY